MATSTTLVTVQRPDQLSPNHMHSVDLELPLDVPVIELVQAIAIVFKWNEDSFGRHYHHTVEVLSPATGFTPRKAQDQETLAELHAWRGAILRLQPFEVVVVKSAPGKAATPPGGPPTGGKAPGGKPAGSSQTSTNTPINPLEGWTHQ